MTRASDVKDGPVGVAGTLTIQLLPVHEGESGERRAAGNQDHIPTNVSEHSTCEPWMSTSKDMLAKSQNGVVLFYLLPSARRSRGFAYS